MRRNLKSTKEDLEEKAQEAAAPKDANSNPIESLPIEGHERKTPAPAPAPALEVDASTPEPTADTVLSSSPEMVTPSPAVATLSVDIMV